MWLLEKHWPTIRGQFSVPQTVQRRLEEVILLLLPNDGLKKSKTGQNIFMSYT